MTTSLMRSELNCLFVEDDSTVRQIVGLILERAGYRYSIARDGGEAISMLHQERYDLVVTDLEMDGIDGRGVLEHLAQNYPLIPAIVLTSTSSIMTMLDCLRMGALTFCTKPIRAGDELLEAMQLGEDIVFQRKRKLHELCETKKQATS